MIDTKQVTDKIQVPPELKQAYEKVIAAGMKLMFEDDSMFQTMVQNLEAENDKSIDQKISDGIIGLMLAMFKKSGGKMPGAVIIPAAVYLLMQVIEFIQKSGHDLPNEVVSAATQQVVFGIMKAFGAGDQQQVLGKFQQMGQAMQQKGGV